MTATTVATTMKAQDKKLEISRAPHVLEACPWLVIHHGKENRLQTFYSASKGRCYTREIPQLRSTNICNSSPNGWLVLEHLETDELTLFNPFSMENIQLPPMASDYKICVLSSIPSDPDCVLLFIGENSSSLQFLKLGGKSQKFKDHFVKGGTIGCPTAFEGNVYWLLPGFQLALIDFSGSKPCLVEVIKEWAIDQSVQPLVTNVNTYLVESCGELLLVKKLYRGLFRQEFLGFSIFRADLPGKHWVQVRDIGQRAIFLDDAQGVSFPTSQSSASAEGNSIYFIEPNDRHLYVFDLEDQRVFTYLPSSQVSRRQSGRRWLMMSKMSTAV